MAIIHRTAIVDSNVVLADDVEIGPYCVVESDVEIGAGTLLRSHVVVRPHVRIGQGNVIESFVVLGGTPQDYKFSPDTVSYVHIGDRNMLREGVTIHRASTPGGATTMGDGCMFMQNSHLGHDATVGDGVIGVSGTVLAGYCRIGDGVILPANGGVHQFVWIGEKVMLQGLASATMHVPPYVICAGTNNVISLNSIGLRRTEAFTDEDRRQIKEAFSMLYRRGLTPARALEAMDACTDWGAPAGRFREFVREVRDATKPYARGLCPRLGRLAGRRGGAG